MLLPQDYNISSQDFFVDFSFVSLVLANSETVFVDVDTSHLRHSPAVDAALGKSKQSMIAVPFVVMNRLCGVLTAVRLHLFAPFVIHKTEVIERQTIALASLLESILIAFSSYSCVHIYIYICKHIALSLSRLWMDISIYGQILHKKRPTKRSLQQRDTSAAPT